MTYVIATMEKLHDAYERGLLPYVICGGKAWIQPLPYREYDRVSGQNRRKQGYVDENDLVHVMPNKHLEKTYLIPKPHVKMQSDTRAEAWINTASGKIILYPILRQGTVLSIEKQEIFPGKDIDEFKQFSETLIHEVLHWLGCKY